MRLLRSVTDPDKSDPVPLLIITPLSHPRHDLLTPHTILCPPITISAIRLSHVSLIRGSYYFWPQYDLYTNYLSPALGVLNPEIDEVDPNDTAPAHQVPDVQEMFDASCLVKSQNMLKSQNMTNP